MSDSLLEMGGLLAQLFGEVNVTRIIGLGEWYISPEEASAPGLSAADGSSRRTEKSFGCESTKTAFGSRDVERFATTNEEASVFLRRLMEVVEAVSRDFGSSKRDRSQELEYYVNTGSRCPEWSKIYVVTMVSPLVIRIRLTRIRDKQNGPDIWEYNIEYTGTRRLGQGQPPPAVTFREIPQENQRQLDL